jgi:O-acetyl-ADP-ribose deacetylase (regulator of RNase III)
MKTVKGDLVKMGMAGEFDVICHGANCFHTMGAGIARQIALYLPMAYEEDKRTSYGDKSKLGTISVAKYMVSMVQPLFIINAYTQFDFRGKMNADYNAIRSCFKNVAHMFKDDNVKIGYPMIGCGLAGGDWNVVSKIIEEELKGMDHTLVLFNK